MRFLAQTESAIAVVQPSRAMDKMMAKAIDKAHGSIPPRNELIASTGQEQAIRPRTGSSRAASLPRTISPSVRSVARICASVPRSRSWQIAPAVADGAASITRANSRPIIA